MLSPLVSSSRVDCVRPPYHVIFAFYEINLAIAVPGRLRLVAALKQYGLCERKREAAHLRSEIMCYFLCLNLN